MTDTHKHILDWLSYGVTAGAIFKLIPAIAGLMSIIWIGWQMYDKFKEKRNGNKRVD